MPPARSGLTSLTRIRIGGSLGPDGSVCIACDRSCPRNSDRAGRWKGVRHGLDRCREPQTERPSRIYPTATDQNFACPCSQSPPNTRWRTRSKLSQTEIRRNSPLLRPGRASSGSRGRRALSWSRSRPARCQQLLDFQPIHGGMIPEVRREFFAHRDVDIPFQP